MADWNELSRACIAAVVLMCSGLIGCNQEVAPPKVSVPKEPVPETAANAQPSNTDKDVDAAPKPSVPEQAIAESPATRADEVADEGPTEFKLPPPPDYLVEPQVVLSEAHRKTSLIGVGDLMPALTLKDRSGNAKEVASLLGENLTVVVFWDENNVLAKEQISRLAREVVQPFGAARVNVVSVYCGESPDSIDKLIPTEVAFGHVFLIDSNRQALRVVATRHFPRTYLLNAEGRVVWFDLEYSRSSARELTNAIHFFLGNRPAEDS